MLIEAEVRARLLSSPELTSIISSRIYPMTLPQPPVLPAVTYSIISRSSVRDLSGVIYYVSRFQFSCWAEQYALAKDVANAIRKSLEDYVGTMGSFRIIDSNRANETDVSEPDIELYNINVDVLITHQGGE